MDASIEKFREILTELKKIKEEEELYKLDDNILFDGAVRIYNSQIISKQKGKSSEKENQPMTQKQRRLLEDLEYRGDMNITKSEATELISKFLEKRQQV